VGMVRSTEFLLTLRSPYKFKLQSILQLFAVCELRLSVGVSVRMGISTLVTGADVHIVNAWTSLDILSPAF
jgi:hypothetical protein